MNPDHVEIVRQGKDAIAKWRDNNPSSRLDLTYADLQDTDLREADLSNADMSDSHLRGADLTDSDLRRVNLSWSNIRTTNLNGAFLSNTDLSHADLTDSTLNHAWLFYANFSGTILERSDFTKANCGNTIFGNVNLSTSRGLDTIEHEGPSTIGIDTLYRSGGKIPESFLRGCGVPEEFIRYLPSLINAESAIQFYSCFISYSHKDEEFAKRLFDRLQGAGLRVWYAPEDMKGGRKLHEQIFEGIRLHDKLLLVLSEESMASEWVKMEICRTRRTEREQKKQKLFPISIVDFDQIQNWKILDPETGENLAVELQTYFIPDFSNWKDHDAFEASFERLLRDLKAV